MHSDLVPSRIRSILPWLKEPTDQLKAVDRIFEDFFTDYPRLARFIDKSDFSGMFVPNVDIEETEDSIKLQVELPGMKEDDVEVKIDHDMLTICGEKKEQKEKKSSHRYYSERRFGSFERSMRLSSDVDQNKIDAKFDNGVLTIIIPKTKDTKKDVKRIPIKH